MCTAPSQTHQIINLSYNLYVNHFQAMWLSMIETQLNIEINLKDMANLQNLIKKNQVSLDHNISTFQDLLFHFTAQCVTHIPKRLYFNFLLSLLSVRTILKLYIWSDVGTWYTVTWATCSWCKRDGRGDVV